MERQKRRHMAGFKPLPPHGDQATEYGPPAIPSELYGSPKFELKPPFSGDVAKAAC